jgi:hypothetical protein
MDVPLADKKGMGIFRTDFRANVRSPRGAIYPEEVVADMVENAQDAIKAKQLLVAEHGDDPQLGVSRVLGVVKSLKLVFGWLEADVEAVRLQAANMLSVPGAEDLFILVPVVTVKRSTKTGTLVVHEAKIEHFTIKARKSDA